MDKKKIAYLKLTAVMAAALILVAVFKFAGLSKAFSLQAVRDFIDGLGVWGPVGFIAVYTLFPALGLPGTIPTVIGGLLFGKWVGSLLNLLGATLGAAVAFFIARFFAREALEEKMKEKDWFRKFNRGLEEDGLYYMLFVRLVPIFPYNGINFGAGVTRLGFKSYIIGTFLGMIPGVFVFTNAAAELGKSAQKGFTFTTDLMVAFALLGLLALIPVAYKRFKGSKPPALSEKD